LVQRDQLVHMWCNSQRQYISDYFRKGMNETDRLKITNGVCTIFLGQQTMFAEFNRGRLVVLSKWKAFAAYRTSALTLYLYRNLCLFFLYLLIHLEHHNLL
jgi:hypothetical protein